MFGDTEVQSADEELLVELVAELDDESDDDAAEVDVLAELELMDEPELLALLDDLLSVL